ncbi:MAG: hypothetical protein ACXWP4_10835 [Polyangiales bacterium]
MSGITVVPLEGLSIESGIVSIDARCVRLSLSWPGGPLCCARGALVDARKKLVLVRTLPDLVWSAEGPILSDAAPSGVFERLAERDGVCGANESDPVRGEGCRIRALDPSLLPPACALFPLDVVEGVLAPSSRIPEASLVEATDSMKSLWDDARPRFVVLYGEAAAKVVDRVAEDVRGHRTRKLHLKTLR